jgi:hypothetical protein
MRIHLFLCCGVLLLGVCLPVDAVADSCRVKAQKLQQLQRQQHRKVRLRALFLWNELVKPCKHSLYAVAAARLAERVHAWDQAINLWSIAIQREHDAEKRREYEAERAGAKDKFTEVARASLKKRQKKKYWDDARGDLVESADSQD